MDLAAKRTGKGGKSTGAQPGDWEIFAGFIDEGNPAIFDIPPGWFDKSKTTRQSKSFQNIYETYIPPHLDRWGSPANYELHLKIKASEQFLMSYMTEMTWKEGRERARALGYEQPRSTHQDILKEVGLPIRERTRN